MPKYQIEREGQTFSYFFLFLEFLRRQNTRGRCVVKKSKEFFPP
jgi:ATP/maltotriose-dependent transcriptional regulator MalT